MNQLGQDAGDDPRFLRIIRMSPFLFVGCLAVAIVGATRSAMPWPESFYFFLGSVVAVVIARVCISRLGEWWWVPVVLAAPWLVLWPLLEPTRIGVIPVLALFLLVLGVPGSLFFGSLLLTWWNRRRQAP